MISIFRRIFHQEESNQRILIASHQISVPHDDIITARKFAKVMFSHLSVSHSVHEGGVWLSACRDSRPLGTRHPRRDQTPPAQCMLGERAVRILLECILVLILNFLRWRKTNFLCLRFANVSTPYQTWWRRVPTLRKEKRCVCSCRLSCY